MAQHHGSNTMLEFVFVPNSPQRYLLKEEEDSPNLLRIH